MDRKSFLSLGLSLVGASAFAQKSEAPNFLFILADDMGWTALQELMDNNNPESCSDYYETPNLNALLRNGVHFSNGYAPAPLSSPSRHSLQSGMNPSHINHVLAGGVPKHIRYGELHSIPKMLKDINPDYTCAHYGKWHLYCDPSVMGYDESTGSLGNFDGDAGVYKTIPYKGPLQKASAWLDVKFSEDPKLVFSLTDRSISFLEQRAADGKPFYLQLSHFATHKKIISTEESYNKFSAKQPGRHHDLPSYAAMLYDMDRSIGRLMEKLRELGLDDNTYIFFMADNGGVPFFPTNIPGREERGWLGNNYPLKMGKWDTYEGGVRVPFIMVGPDIPSGTQCDIPVVGYDWFPTVLEIAGYKGALPDQLDGTSFYRLATGEEKSRGERPFIFHYPNNSPAGTNRPTSVILRGRYKYIHFLDTNEELLYDLEADLSEQKDISGSNPELVRSMRKELDAYHAKVKPSMWDPNRPRENKKSTEE